jgi:hypothetical protein
MLLCWFKWNNPEIRDILETEGCGLLLFLISTFYFLFPIIMTFLALPLAVFIEYIPKTVFENRVCVFLQ